MGGLPRASPSCLAAQEKEEGGRRLTGVAAPAQSGEHYLRLLAVAACSTCWLLDCHALFLFFLVVM